MTATARHPFGADLEEIPLDPAPLVTVIAQIRFPRFVNLTSEKSVGAFQDAIRVEYPIMREEKTQSIAVTAAGPIVSEPLTVFRFEDLESQFQVNLTQESLSLETSNYTNRDEFVERLERIFIALNDISTPGPVAVYDRLGIRYINRLTGDDTEHHRLKELLCDEVYGPLTIAESLADGHELVASLTQQQYKLNNHTLLARWATLPPGGVLAPGLDPIDANSWVLDVDAFVEGQAPFEPHEAATIAREGSKLAYDLFRWAMTDQFIQERSTGSS